MVRVLKQTLDKHMKHAGHARWFRAFVALVFLISTAIPAFMWIDGMKAYAISPEAEKVIGSANKNLSAKFSFDETGNKWQFNKNGAAALAADIAKQQGTNDIEGVAGALSQLTAKQVGGGGEKDTTLYSVDLPVKAKEGITYYDNVNKLSFKMVPDFGTRDGKLVQDRIVYPFGDGAQVVYTAKTNGLKEDIVLSKYIADTVRYSYNLELPDTLEAKLLEDGSIGIYSASLALFGNVSFSGDEDKARVMDARKNGTKDNLVFSIPPPFIKDQTGNAGRTKYLLNDNRVTVVADQLKNLKYPLTVDPSVTVTSSSDFKNGNDEGMSDIATADQISRSGITGGTFGAWNFTDNSANRGVTQNAGSGAANGMITARNSHGTAVYNGYIYVTGGGVPTARTNLVERAPINANGTLGTWVSSTPLPEARLVHSSVAYNGFLYIIGGSPGGGSLSADVKFAPINSSDGSLGSWSSTASLPIGRANHATVVYNNMMYVLNGCTTAEGNCNTANPTAIVYCAPLNATGQITAWNTCNSSGLTARVGFDAVAYNGFIYGVGGCASYTLASCSSQPVTVQYAPINNDGTLGNWLTSTTTFTTARDDVDLTVHNGYLFLTGNTGSNYTNVVQYASLNASGDVGSWATGLSYVTARSSAGFKSYNGYLYVLGGCDNYSASCNNTRNDVQYTKIDAAGALRASNTTTSYDTSANGRVGHAVITANGYIYALGGRIEGVGVGTNTVRFAPISSDGSIGTWSNTNAFAEPRVNAAAVVYGQRMYLIGGSNDSGTANCPDTGAGTDYCRNIEWATIDPATGALTWQASTFTYSTQGRTGFASAVNNGFLYVMGGIFSNNTNESSEVNYAQINSDGTLGTFAQTTASLQTARGHVAATAMNGKIYIVGGRAARTNEVATPAANGDITSWGFTGGSRSGPGEQSFAIAASKGVFYLTGGLNSGANVTNVVESIRINADGSMGSWATSNATLTAARRDHSMAIYNDYMYVLSGNASNVLNNVVEDVWYHRINNGGSGATGTWAASPNDANSALGGYTSYNGYVYNIRGCSTGGVGAGDLNCDNLGSGTSSMTYAAVNTDGTFGSWQALGSTGAPGRRYGLSAVAHNGFLYVVGGCTAYTSSNCSATSNEVFYAPLDSGTGNVGNWTTTTAFHATTGRYGLSAVAHNGFLYVVGGCTASSAGSCTSYESTVLRAQLDSSTGAITPSGWSSAGADFSGARAWHGATVYNDKLYVLGGCTVMVTEGCTGLRSDVQFIGINGSGSLEGSWQNGRPFLTPRSAFGVTAYNGYLYVVGGCAMFNATGGNCSDYKNDIQYAPISSGGDMGAWEKSISNLTTGIMAHGLVVSRGYLITLFGFSATHSFQTVARSSPLQVMSRTGKYSKLVSIPSTTDIAGAYYTSGFGLDASMSYKVAPTSGILGSSTPGIRGTGSEPTPKCGLGNIYYVQFSIIMDDSNRATFPDNNAGNISEVKIYYRINATPPPSLRMTGGKWFWDETQRPLDTCKEPNA